ncbi:MAG TPA: ATPase [Elusimicrobia bacterium]|nr:ATPase [Elusimicrobiota bacterium]
MGSMKRFALPAACLAALLAAGCGDKSSKDEKVLKIGFSVPSSRETRWARDLAQMRSQAEEIGVQLLTAVSENNAPQQLAQCDSLLAGGVAVLIVAPQDARAAGEIARRARKAGVKVIAYDRMILGAPVDLYVSFDNRKVGQLQARALAARAPRGNYVLLSGAPTDTNSAVLRRGALDVLEPLAARGDIKIVMDQAVKDWHPAEAQRLVAEALLQNSGDIQAVLAPNDTTAGAAIKALEQYQLAGKVPVSGQDAEAAAIRRILAGTQEATVFKDPRQQAAAAFGAAMSLAASGRVPEATFIYSGKNKIPALLLAPQGINKDNANEVLVVSGFISLRELRAKPAETAADNSAN